MTYLPEMKPFIEFAMNLDLQHLDTHNGYKGAAILTLSFGNRKDLETMLEYCKNNTNEEVKFSHQSQNVSWDVFIPFEREDICGLKPV